MGSFDMMCSISGLPIQCGDPIKVVFLTANPYGDVESMFAPHGHYAPRAPAIDAMYDDYGLPLFTGDVAVALKQFHADTVVQGWGDNSVRDVPTHRQMSMTEILNAIQEQRMVVKSASLEGGSMSKLPKGVPSLKRVTRLLKSANIVVNDGFGSYLVDRHERGTISVRVPCGQSMGRVKSLLERRYAVMETVYGGNSTETGCLWVRPKPGVHLYPSDAKCRKASVDMAMIHTDVWNGLLQEHQDQRAIIDKSVRKAVETIRGRTSDILGIDTFCHYLRDPYPCFQGLSSALKFGASTKDVLDTLSIDYALATLKKMWDRSIYAGQTHRYDVHEKFSKLVSDLAKERHAKDIEERKQWED